MLSLGGENWRMNQPLAARAKHKPETMALRCWAQDREGDAGCVGSQTQPSRLCLWEEERKVLTTTLSAYPLTGQLHNSSLPCPEAPGQSDWESVLPTPRGPYDLVLSLVLSLNASHPREGTTGPPTIRMSQDLYSTKSTESIKWESIHADWKYPLKVTWSETKVL